MSKFYLCISLTFQGTNSNLSQIQRSSLFDEVRSTLSEGEFQNDISLYMESNYIIAKTYRLEENYEEAMKILLSLIVDSEQSEIKNAIRNNELEKVVY